MLVDGPARDHRIDGIDVDPRSRARDAEYARDADVVIGQLDARWTGMKLAARHGRPYVYYMHIGATPRSHLSGRPDLTVFSSRVVQQRHPWITPSLVVHPPVDPADYRTTPGDAITLVNLSEQKGAPVFWALAARLPDRTFVGARGWGPQLVPPDPPPNVELVGPVDDMRAVYGRTRVLLVPSSYESFGRVALEAGVSGIPAIAHPAEGLRETLGDAPIWVDRDDIDGWVDAVEQLDDSQCYEARSRAARDCASQYDGAAEIDALEHALHALVREHRR